jgi:hypothetical protein
MSYSREKGRDMKRIAWLAFWFFVLANSSGGYVYIGPFPTEASCEAARTAVTGSLTGSSASVCAQQ